MPSTTLEDHVRMMLGRLVMENLVLLKQLEDLKAELEALRAASGRPAD
mgnify:CR=1 FL=1